MPRLATDSGDGRIVTWLKDEGEAVERGEDLLEVETDKTTISVQAANSGVLAQIVHVGGDEVPGGETIGYIETA